MITRALVPLDYTVSAVDRHEYAVLFLPDEWDSLWDLIVASRHSSMRRSARIPERSFASPAANLRKAAAELEALDRQVTSNRAAIAKKYSEILKATKGRRNKAKQ